MRRSVMRRGRVTLCRRFEAEVESKDIWSGGRIGVTLITQHKEDARKMIRVVGFKGRIVKLLDSGLVFVDRRCVIKPAVMEVPVGETA